MKLGVTVSSVAHVAILAFAMISLPSPEEYDTSNFESLPVEIVSVEEFTNLRQGELDAPEPVETPPAVAADVPEPDEKSAQQEEKAAVESQAEPEPVPEEPEPASEPVAESDAEPAPTPVTAEPEPEPAQPETVAEEPVKLPVARPKSVPQRPKPTEVAEKPQEPEEKQFAPQDIAALLDKETTENRRAATGSGAGAETATLGARTGTQSAMSQSELDYLRSQISRCWSPPIGGLDPAELIVRVQMNLNPDGSVAATEVLEFRASATGKAAADSAIRAVKRCQPYQLPGDKYATWQTVNINFDPREMLN